jgi:elongation factor 1-beta
MGKSAVQYKIMPESLDIDLGKIEEEAKAVIEEMGGVFSASEQQPIAFGLKALVVSLAYPEEKEIDLLGNALADISGVSSAEMIDYRRALG